ncbi:hypothetical protein NQ315_010760, partial [Exocentrus adspersus]
HKLTTVYIGLCHYCRIVKVKSAVHLRKHSSKKIIMDKPAEICETYQLKWSSYNAYFHSCIATSLQDISMADVALVTVDGHQIMAHRFVLTYSSMFLSQILRYQPKVTTALPLMIVMPPEIDYKTLKVLVRYMYSGEAKVSKEILNNVLRGGDILQVKGLFREKEDPDKDSKVASINQRPATSAPPAASAVATTSSSTTTTTNSSNPDKKHSPTVLNKPLPSPVTIQEKPVQTQKVTSAQKQKDHQTYSKSKPKVLNFTIMRNYEKIKSGDNTKRKNSDQGGSKDNKANTTNEEQLVAVKTEPSSSSRDGNLSYLVIKDEPIEWSEADMEIVDSKEVFDEMTVKSENETYESESNEEEIFSPLTCELCTETFTIPAEWVRHVQTHTDMMPAKRRRRDSPGDSYENNTFPELMCDMCQKSFPTPAEWVRHIQDTHTDFELHLSNKKLHHGKAQVPAPATATTSGVTTEFSKKCTECNKAFPSHASMIIHKRSHTGERPYACEFCNKNFNVKSNLLRHLRTVHNKIVNSTEIENKDSDNSND